MNKATELKLEKNLYRISPEIKPKRNIAKVTLPK